VITSALLAQQARKSIPSRPAPPAGREIQFRLVEIASGTQFDQSDTAICPMRLTPTALLLNVACSPMAHADQIRRLDLSAAAGGFVPASAEDWHRASTVTLDKGPELPGTALASPGDYAPLAIGGHRFQKSGANWLHYLFATNGSYLALFSTDARRTGSSDATYQWSGDNLELAGNLFVDVYRVRDGMKVAQGAYRFHGDDHPAEIARRARWLDSRVLILPVASLGHTALLLAAFPQLPALPLPLKGCTEWCGETILPSDFGPPAVRLLATRDEGVDADKNGLFESIRVVAKVNLDFPGKYEFVMELEGGNGHTLHFQGKTPKLERGPQEIAAEFSQEEWRKGGPTGVYRWKTLVLHLRSNLSEAAVPVTAAKVTRAYPASVLFAGSSYYVADGATVRKLDDRHDGVYHMLEIEVTFFSQEDLQGGTCRFQADLVGGPSHALLERGMADPALHRGYNRIKFLVPTRYFAKRVTTPPFYLAHLQKKCDVQPYGLGETKCTGSIFEEKCSDDPSQDRRAKPVKIPDFDFVGVEDAHCAEDYNNDGVVDDKDIKAFIDRIPDNSGLSAQSMAPGGELWLRAKRIVDEGRGCRTK